MGNITRKELASILAEKGYHLDDIPEDLTRLSPLTTDLYQFTMSKGMFDNYDVGTQEEIINSLIAAQKKFEQGLHPEESTRNIDTGIAAREASYYQHWRDPAFKNANYSVVVGTEKVIEFIKNFEFLDDDINFLRTLEKKGRKLFTEEFLSFLKNTPLKLDVDILPEGTIQTTSGTTVRVNGPTYQAQIIESAVLALMNKDSKIATRASLIHTAADDEPVAAFGLRRAAEIAGDGARASYIGGCSVIADLDAGRRYGIPVTGTMAHAFIMNYQQDGVPNIETELLAFKKYLISQPMNTVLLVDTYDTKQGINNAIKASIEVNAAIDLRIIPDLKNIDLDGVRLDSGDTAELADYAWYAYKKFEEAKKTHPELFKDSKIFVTNDLDEEKILEIKKILQERSIAEDKKDFPKICVWGVGTKLQNPGPLQGGVYKVAAYEKDGEVVGTMKVAGVNESDPALPSYKASIPGEKLDILRLWNKGKIVADIIIDHNFGIDELLKNGKGINLHDNKTEVILPEFDKHETLLKSAFKRNDKGISEYVYQEPEKKKLYNGRMVTNLEKVREYHIQQKMAYPEKVIEINSKVKPTVLIDPRIQKHRLEIIAKTNSELQPDNEITGDLSAKGNQKEIKIN